MGWPYFGTQKDLWALGVILFMLKVGCPPFKKAHKSCPFFKAFRLEKRRKRFWDAHFERHVDFQVENSFKDLILQFFQAKPKDRITIKDIKSHPWYKGEVATSEEVKIFMTNLDEKVELMRSQRMKTKDFKIPNMQGHIFEFQV